MAPFVPRTADMRTLDSSPISSDRPAGRRRTPRIGIGGLGYVGLATALGFAEKGLTVTGYDLVDRLRQDLRSGRTNLAEPGVNGLLRRVVGLGRLQIVDSWQSIADDSEVIFLCLPTPRRANGSIDLRPIVRGAQELGKALRSVRGYRLVVVKSTVVPGTTEKTIRPILEKSSGHDARWLGVAANPEFLAEGTMLRDVLRPERIVVGVSAQKDARVLANVYRRFRAPRIVLSPRGAELVKYASNAFLASRVAFTNEISRIAEREGVDVDRVMRAVGLDSRIGRRYLSAGPGFGGSCFEKDVRALVQEVERMRLHPRILEAIVPSNADQTRHAFDLIQSAVGPLRGRTIALLGLSFKAGTDDVRESRALPIVRWAVGKGAQIRLHDPRARANFQRLLGASRARGVNRVRFLPSPIEAVSGADVAVIQAAWPDYLGFPRAWVRKMRRPVVVDLRRALPPSVTSRGDLVCVRLGDGTSQPALRRLA